jgi:pimeloyl-ACP methyl ester carboxylesterase
VNEQDVTFDSGGSTLAGTYTEAVQPVAAALLIQGSGRTDRNSDARLPLGKVLRLDVTRALAEALASAHVSSFRYDKRGIGASGGDYLTTGMSQLLEDARAALGWLATKTAGLPLIVAGHSEGTYYAAQLAADGGVATGGVATGGVATGGVATGGVATGGVATGGVATGGVATGGVAGVVLLSGPVRTGGEILAWQTQQLASRLPRSARLILKLMRTDLVRAQRKNQDRIMASAGDVVRIQGVRVNARWVRDFVRYDPALALRQLTVPVLAITGGHDLQVPEADVAAIGQLVGGPFEGHVVGDLSHILRPDPDSVGPRGYRRAVRAAVSTEVLSLVTTWTTRLRGNP